MQPVLGEPANCFVKHQRVLQNPFLLVHWGFCQADHVY